MYRPALDASSPSEICEYMLANRNIGTNAIEIRKRITLSAVNARFAKIRTCMSGYSVRSCVRTKATVSAAPRTIEPIVLASSQPQTADCWSPRTSRPMPSAKRTAPR